MRKEKSRENYETSRVAHILLRTHNYKMWSSCSLLYRLTQCKRNQISSHDFICLYLTEVAYFPNKIPAAIQAMALPVKVTSSASLNNSLLRWSYKYKQENTSNMQYLIEYMDDTGKTVQSTPHTWQFLVGTKTGQSTVFVIRRSDYWHRGTSPTPFKNDM